MSVGSGWLGGKVDEVRNLKLSALVRRQSDARTRWEKPRAGNRYRQDGPEAAAAASILAHWVGSRQKRPRGRQAFLEATMGNKDRA